MNITTLHALFLKNKKVTTDSRTIEKGSIFFALKGASFNGNAFAAEALQKGAVYAVIDEAQYKTGERTILVEDVLKTLQQLAAYHRKTLNLPVLALTGSNGKTTTKELIHAVLSKKFRTVATRGNLNNHIGVPLTLLSMDTTTEFGIVEMGANHLGEIAALCAIAAPDYGCITNFGKAHLEGFGSIAGVIKGKTELYDDLMQNRKTVFYNADDEVQTEKLKTYDKKYGFSREPHKAEVHIALNNSRPFVGISVKDMNITSQLIGAYNFNNIAMAMAIGSYFKVPLEAVKEAIENYVPRNNRSQLMEKKSNTLILDAYNANPSSMKAALDHLATLPAPHKMAFLGDMFELGAEAAAEHQNIADYAREKGLEAVYLIGENFYRTQTPFHAFRTFEAFVEVLKKMALTNTTILIKGSRGMALERVVDFL